MEHLSYSLIRQIALSLPFSEITYLCRTNKRFNQAICKYQIFWYNKLVHDYAITENFSEDLDWKKIYNIYIYRLIGWGYNDFGQLGLGEINQVNELTEIPTIAVKDVACGSFHTIIIDIDGNLWGTGENKRGELGINTRGQYVRNFTQLTHDLKFIQVVCGFDHTLALSEDNKIWATGSNYLNGQLGLGSIGQVNQFTELKGYQAKQISSHDHHSAFIDLNGNLYTFGEKIFFEQSGRDGDRTIPGKVSIPGDISIIQVSCGAYHTACIGNNNDIWVFGHNKYGQLGLGNSKGYIKYPEKISNHKAKYISCGSYHTAFIDLDDRVWTFGMTIYESSHHPVKITRVYDQGQIVDIDFRVKRVYCGVGVTWFIDLGENLWATGEYNNEIPVMIPRIKASKMAPGIHHNMIIGYYN